MAENIIWKDDTVTTTDDPSKAVEGPTTLEYIPRFGEVKNEGTETYDGEQWLPTSTFKENEYRGQYLYGGRTAKKLKETAVGLYEGARDLEEKITPQFVKDHNQIKQKIMMQSLSQGVSLVGKGYHALPPKGKEAVQTFGSGVKWAAEQTDKSILGYSHYLGTTPILTEALFTAAEVAFTAGTGPGGRKLLQEVLTSKQVLQPAYVANRVVDGSGLVRQGTDDLAEMFAKPLQVGHKMERSTRTDSLEGLIKADAPNKKVRDFIKEGPGGAIKGKYLEISADQLAAKPELLEQLFKRNKNIKKLQETYLTKLSKWQKNPRPSTQAAKNNAQRAWYDEVTKNLFDHELLIYGKDKPRQLVAQATKWATRDQWHHIFGNKEAGEFFLAMAAQDPLVVVNLMKHMQKLKLSTSGIADNIAIMKATGHNNFHLWLKEMGFESVAGKQAPLALDQYATEISEYITKGVQTTAKSGKPKFYPPEPEAVNDLFEILEYYSEANKFIRQKLKSGKITMEDGTVLNLASGKTNKLPEVMSELKSKKISGFGDVLRSGELMKAQRPGRPRTRVK